jgi:methylmalonyl-CoA/ethylmalonyl-CoA epimerase
MSIASAQNDPAVQLDTIGQIALTVRDVERSTAFYRDTLGMKFLFSAGHLAFFQCGTVRLMLGTSEQPLINGGTILYFKVADIEATHAVLSAAGVSFLQKPHLVAKMPDHDLWMAFLKDPDDNTLGLMCEIPTSHAA